MRTLTITGIGGFMGCAFTRHAVQRGLTVRGIDASPEGARRASALGASVVIGDVTDPRAVRRACEGADAVVHTAAVVREDGPWDAFRRINVGGTDLVGRIAAECGVSRFLHMSSVMVYGFDYPRWVDESGPLRGEDNPYCQTKIESERAILAHHGDRDLQVVILRPGDVYGPGSRPWVVRPVELMSQRLFVLPDGGRGTMNHLHIDNLADAVWLALETPHVAQPFNVTDGRETSFGEYFRRLADAAGCPRPPTAPSGVLRPLFGVIEHGARWLGHEPPASASALSFIRRPHPCSIDAARQRLGYTPRVSLDQGMDEVGQWLRAQGLARAG